MTTSFVLDVSMRVLNSSIDEMCFTGMVLWFVENRKKAFYGQDTSFLCDGGATAIFTVLKLASFEFRVPSAFLLG